MRKGEGSWEGLLTNTTLEQYTWSYGQGEHAFRVRARDGAGNESEWSEAVTTTVDVTGPSAGAASIATDSARAWVSGTRVYYGVGAGTFTVSLSAGDGGSGLASIVYPATVSAGGTYAQGGAPTATVSHPYTFAGTEGISGTYAITVTDRAGHEVLRAFEVYGDPVSPAVAMRVRCSGANDVSDGYGSSCASSRMAVRV
jgi:hypothetical protein